MNERSEQLGGVGQDDVPTGQMRLVSFYQPGIGDGAYDVTLKQTVAAPGATVAPVTRRFVVAGPRFALDPADVHAQYPPAAASGPFADVLPHVVLTERLLPWERPCPPLPTTTPWLALLTFQDGELLADPAADPTKLAISGYAVTTTVSDLLAEASTTVRVPHVTPDTPDEAAMSCQVITVDSATFAALVPTAWELPYLAHGRDVDADAKVLLDMTDPGQFSVVVANRFPLAGSATLGARCIVHLVTLEGFADLLDGSTPVTPSEQTVKLVSLYSWTFSCLADPSQTFSGLAQNLAYDATGALRPPSTLRLALIPAQATADAAPDPAAVTATRLADGYIAAGYHARSGEDGFAWYRGPCTPTVPEASFEPGTFATSSSATIFDPTTGVFDHSLAAAWQCGRSLALADQAFAEALLRLRQKARNQLHRQLVGGADLRSVDGQHSEALDAYRRLAALVGAGALASIATASSATSPTPAADPGTAAPTPTPISRLRRLLDTPEIAGILATALADDPDAQSVAAWLGDLCLLDGVPFNHLVPDARMLPAETVRWFYLDPVWIAAMIDGALTVGLATSEESAVQDALTAELATMAEASALAARATALKQPLPVRCTGPMSGLLIRSALATGWPGLTISGTADGDPVATLRLDVIAPNVFICLFNGVPDTVTLEQPHEGLAFGVDDEGAIVLRTVDGSTIVDGAQLVIYDPQDPTAPRPSVRTGGGRVLNINTTVQPSAADANPPAPPVDLLGVIAHGLQVSPTSITAAAFALQMVDGPELLTFSPTPPPKPEDS
jgi:hypothetical protein